MIEPSLERRDECPVCQSTQSKIILDLPYDNVGIQKYLNNFYSKQGYIEHQYLAGRNYTLTSCLRCGLIYQKEIPNESLMHKIYDEWISPEYAFQQTRALSIKRILKYLNNLYEISRILIYISKKTKSMHFLDFGAGWCEWLRLVRRFGVSTSCSELSPSRINNASRYGITNTLLDTSTPEQYDYINTEQVFEHVAQPRAVLKQLVKLLKVDGIIKISVPDSSEVSRLFGASKKLICTAKLLSYNQVAPLEHINCFSHNNLLLLAESEDLKLISGPKWFTLSLVQLARICFKPSLWKHQSTYLFFKKLPV